MSKIKFAVSSLALGLSMVSTCFADQTFEVQYHYYHAYVENACPASLTNLIDNKTPFTLTYNKSSDAVKLLGSNTPGVTISEQVQLNKEDHESNMAYMSEKSTVLKIAGSESPLQQLWIESAGQSPWESAFYLGKNKYCIVMTSPEAEMNTLSQPRG